MKRLVCSVLLTLLSSTGAICAAELKGTANMQERTSRNSEKISMSMGRTRTPSSQKDDIKQEGESARSATRNQTKRNAAAKQGLDAMKNPAPKRSNTIPLPKQKSVPVQSSIQTINDKSAATTHSSKRMLNTSGIEKLIVGGTLSQGETALQAELNAFPENDNARFGLGIVQFVHGIEQFGQSLYKFGLLDHSERLSIPFLRLPVKDNPNPQTIKYDDAREMAQTLLNNLTKAEATLAQVKDENVKLPLHFAQIKLDLNGDGSVAEKESLFWLYMYLQSRYDVEGRVAQMPKQFVIGFDRGDVHWLQGYCHLLSSVLEVYLAHDTREFFDCTAHMLFNKVDTPYTFLREGKSFKRIKEDFDLFDLIAAVHLTNFEVLEPARMESSLHHLEAVIAQSRLTWKSIMAETDDDHEWLPNPRQTGVIPDMKVTEEMVTSWAEIMNESERILKGELLIPFWRGNDPNLGVNLRKVFTNPRRLDAVLWVQGSAACPYLERGKLTKMDTWRELTRSFGGNFPGFAIWFN